MKTIAQNHDRKIFAFLEREVPGSEPSLTQWKAQAHSLGNRTPAICKLILEKGPVDLHYAALLVLRQFGYDAAGQGQGVERGYLLRNPSTGKTIRMIPENHPAAWSSAKKWLRAWKRPGVRSHGGTLKAKPSRIRKAVG